MERSQVMKIILAIIALAIIIDVLWLSPITAALTTIATISLMIYGLIKLVKETF